MLTMPRYHAAMTMHQRLLCSPTPLNTLLQPVLLCFFKPPHMYCKLPLHCSFPNPWKSHIHALGKPCSANVSAPPHLVAIDLCTLVPHSAMSHMHTFSKSHSATVPHPQVDDPETGLPLRDLRQIAWVYARFVSFIFETVGGVSRLSAWSAVIQSGW